VSSTSRTFIVNISGVIGFWTNEMADRRLRAGALASIEVIGSIRPG